MYLKIREKKSLAGDANPIEFNLKSVKDYPYHWHDYLEMLLVLEGNITLFVSTNHKTLNPGDVEIINFNEIHRIKGSENNAVLSLKVPSGLARELVPEIEETIFDLLMVPHKKQKRHTLYTFSKMLCQFFLFQNNRGTEEINPLVKERVREILSYLMDHFDIVNQALYKRELSSGERSLLRDRYRRVADYIFKNSSGRIGLKEIAEKENLSVYFLSREIKSLFGDGFQELVNFQRIHKAMKMLVSTDYNMTEIAYECGYSAPRYLTLYFKKLVGMTPLNFRIQYRRERDRISIRSMMKDIPEEKALEIITGFLSDFQVAGQRLRQEILVDAACDPLFYYSGWKHFAPEPPGGPVFGTRPFLPDVSTDSMGPSMQFLKKILFSRFPPPTSLSGPFFTASGLKKPLWFLADFLSTLGEEVLVQAADYLVCRSGRMFQVFLCNFAEGPSPLDPSGRDRAAKEIRLELRQWEGKHRIVRYSCHNGTLSLYDKWLRMGCPEVLPDETLLLLDRTLFPLVTFSSFSDTADLSVLLPPSAYEFLVISPAD